MEIIFFYCIFNAGSVHCTALQFSICHRTWRCLRSWMCKRYYN